MHLRVDRRDGSESSAALRLTAADCRTYSKMCHAMLTNDMTSETLRSAELEARKVCQHAQMHKCCPKHVTGLDGGALVALACNLAAPLLQIAGQP